MTRAILARWGSFGSLPVSRADSRQRRGWFNCHANRAGQDAFCAPYRLSERTVEVRRLASAPGDFNSHRFGGQGRPSARRGTAHSKNLARRQRELPVRPERFNFQLPGIHHASQEFDDAAGRAVALDKLKVVSLLPLKGQQVVEPPLVRKFAISEFVDRLTVMLAGRDRTVFEHCHYRSPNQH